MESQVSGPSLREQLDAPETVESISRLIDRAKDLDQLIDRFIRANKAADGLVATITDIVDEQCEKINQSGTSVDERIGSLVDLFMKITGPGEMSALSKLVDQLPQLEEVLKLLEIVPGLVAIATDVVDEYAINLRTQGIDLEKSIAQGIHALLWLGSRVSEEELDRLGYLLRSDVLDPNALEVVGRAATSLAICQRESCEQKTQNRVGLVGLLNALRDPNFQRSVGFGVRFAKNFGDQITQSSNDFQESP